jgi:hypothetical protein
MKDIRKKIANYMLLDRDSLDREHKRSNASENDALQKNLILRLPVNNQK